MWAKIKKKLTRQKLKKYTNGAISLFLVVTMLPFLSIAALLIETNRYNSCISALDEIMGSSSVSTLSSYDRFLLNRFGLLAIDQQESIDMVYKNYLEQNSGIMGKGMDIDSISASGDFPLSSPEMLKHQIMEFSALNAPVQIATEAIRLDTLISKLEGLANIGDIFSVITSGTDVLNETKDLY